MSQPIATNALEPARRQRFQQLTRAPKIAWPTFWLWLILLSANLTSYWMSGTHQWPRRADGTFR